MTDCMVAGLIAAPDRVAVADEIDTPHARVVDPDPQSRDIAGIERWLEAHGVAFTGSRGAWETGGVQGVLCAGREAALAAR